LESVAAKLRDEAILGDGLVARVAGDLHACICARPI
jgi:hypothetical protein